VTLYAWCNKAKPTDPPDRDDHVVMAVRQLQQGKANESQQKLVWDYVMYLTKADDRFQDISYRPGPDGMWDTAFAEGRRSVGINLKTLFHPALTPKRTTPRGEAVEGETPSLPVRMTRAQRRAAEKLRKAQGAL
jgi:hypothetical protein